MAAKKQGDLSVLLDYAGGHKALTIVGCVLSVIAMLMGMAPYICIWLVARDLIAVAPNWELATNIATYGWAAFWFAVGGIVVYFFALMCTHLAAFRTASNIRKQGMAHMMSAPLGYFDNNASGLIRNRLDGGAGETETLLAHNLADISGTVAMLIGVIVLMVVFDWRMGVACLLAAVISIVAMFTMMGGENAGLMAEYQAAQDRMSKAGVEYVRGIPVVKVFQQTVYSFKAFKEAIDAYSEKAGHYQGEVCRMPQTVNLTFTEGAFMFLVPVALVLAPGALSAGDFAGFVTDFAFYAVFSAIISTALAKVMFAASGTMLATTALGRINEVMDAPALEVASDPVVPQGNRVEFKDVTFTYGGAAEPALKNVSLVAEPGQTIALVGPSGGGKTTAASLIPRFWDVDSGVVEVGGVDVRQIDPHVLMDQIAFVFQNNRLFKTSILENVRAARPDASRDDVLAALAAAQCDDIIAKLPDGIDTVIGAAGTYLSGGEQQRVALARAILKDAPIVVLDEATAFADPENEALIQKAFATLMRGRTVVMIAHRLSTVVGADKIVVLDSGRVVEQGTHDELVVASGLYSRMWADYGQAVEWRIENESENVSLTHFRKNESEIRSPTHSPAGEPSKAEADRVPEEAAASAVAPFGRMTKSIQRKYALSDQGVATTKKGTFWTVIVNLIMMAGMGILYFLMMGFMETLESDGPLPSAAVFIGVTVAFLVLSLATHYQQYAATYGLVYEEVKTMRLGLAERLRKLPLGFFGKRDLADLTETIMGDVNRMEHVWSHVLGYLYGGYISTAIIAVMLLAMDWRLAIACLWGVPVAFLLLFGSRRISERNAEKTKAAALAVADGMQEALENVREIHATNQEQRYLDELNAKIDACEREKIRSEFVTGLFVNGASVIMRLGVATTVLAGANLILSGQVDFMLLFMFLLVITRVYAPFDQSLALIAEVFMSEVSAKRLMEIYDTPTAEGAMEFAPQGHDIVFKDVGFSYDDEQVLCNVSFTAKEGEVTALVGPSGSGKSTCARLAARLWDVSQGAIEVGGVNIATIDPEVLLGDYSMVFQDVTLFDDTVMENIRLGKHGATDEEVRAAATAANCDEFVDKLPLGYATLIGENGAKLSGGERQRISIARALLKDAPIVLLDEATASLDVENETKVQSALSRLLAGKTVLVIAHRMRTVENADKVVVLTEGAVVEEGSPAELMANEGSVFAHMARLQAASAGWSA